MALAFEQAEGDEASGQSGSIFTPAMATVTGRFLFVTVSHYNSGINISGVTDTAGNTYVKAGTTQGGDGNHDHEIWYTPSPITGHATNEVTATFSSPAGFRVITVSEFSHPTATAVAYTSEAAHNLVAIDSGVAPSNSLTTTGTDALIIGSWVAWDDAESLSNNSGTITFASNPGGADGSATAYRVAATAGSYTISLTATTVSAGTDNYSVIAKSFNFTLSGGGTTINATRQQLVFNSSNDANVDLDKTISAASSARAITGFGANVDLDKTITVGLDTLAISTLDFSPAFDRNVQAAVQAMSIAENAFSASSSTSISANVAVVNLTELPSATALDILLQAESAGMTVTTADASIVRVFNIPASLASLLITERKATVGEDEEPEDEGTFWGIIQGPLMYIIRLIKGPIW